MVGTIIIHMGVRAVAKQFPRNIFLAALIGFICTMVGAFLTRYCRWTLFRLPYGVDDPFGPIANIIRNSFWIGVVLVVCSAFCDPRRMKNDALPILFLNIQVFVGLALFVALASAWHSVRLPGEDTVLVLLLLTFLGQASAYLLEKSQLDFCPASNVRS